MKKVFLLGISLTLALPMTFAQAKAPVEKSDPEAKKVLDKLRRKYETYKSFEVAFNLNIELPGQPKEVQKGTVGQQGKKFRLTMDQQEIITDGVTTWIYLKGNNEVQINNAEDESMGSEFLSPRELLNRYNNGDYLYAITDKVAQKSGGVLTMIEFKPTNRESEYAKLRLEINEEKQSLERIKAFAKDGSRYTFEVTSLNPNKNFAANHFSFDKNKYPGATVVDLRL